MEKQAQQRTNLLQGTLDMLILRTLLYGPEHRLTDKGTKQLVVEESQWKQMTEAVARVMWPTVEAS
jgi:hypothetical protein